VRVIEHFRHSIRTPPSEHLSRDGVTLARRVGEGLGGFDLVVTSELPRAIETAIAMGYGVDRYSTTLGSLMLADKEVEVGAGCAALAEAAMFGGLTSDAARVHANLMRSIAGSLPEDGRALVVSHGDVIELGVIGLLPDYDFSFWGPSCERCEGVRLHFQGTDCTGAELLRVSDLIPNP
jgi:broad specificity phosphatase PhoE